MNTKTVSDRALATVDQYIHFRIGNAVCSIPYFNNRTTRQRASLRTLIGKGSPKDIYEEIMSVLVKSHVDQNLLSDESLKKILCDNNIGIDCSGFVYYVLNAESEERRLGPIDKNIKFVNCHGLFGKMRCAIRPVENCDVSTFSNEKNSKIITTKDVLPGDIITMIGGPDVDDRDHVLVIHQIEYQNFAPTKIHYSHAVRYSDDGLYGSGIKQGEITVSDISKSITEQIWTENGKSGSDNILHIRAIKSRTELRRMRAF